MPWVKFCYSGLQYVAHGPRGKIIILNISPESELHELKFFLKIVFMFLVITVSGNFPDNILFL